MGLNKHIPLVTVFTPTYNRAHTLNRVFESLNNQTFTDFEWVIIDDGSTDGTGALVEALQKTAGFAIHYHFQPNSGKHIAFNRAVVLAKGELFLPIDSDDGFAANSLEIMLHWWLQIPVDERTKFTGIVTLCRYVNGEICGNLFKESPFDTTALELRYVHQHRGETWGFHRTEVLRKFPFPEDPNVRFIPENIIWDAIAREYKIRCINEPLRIFYQDSGNQITKAEPRKKAVVRRYFLEMINRDSHYFFDDPLTFLKWAVLYVRYSLHAKDWLFMAPKRFTGLMPFLLVLVGLVPGVLVFVSDVLPRWRPSWR
jgi:glycosyltransferase involved in cell wall biosynthesis